MCSIECPCLISFWKRSHINCEVIWTVQVHLKLLMYVAGSFLQPCCEIRRHREGETTSAHATNGGKYELAEPLRLQPVRRLQRVRSSQSRGTYSWFQYFTGHFFSILVAWHFLTYYKNRKRCPFLKLLEVYF